MLIVLIVSALIFGFVGAMILEPRNQFGEGFVLGLLLGPIGLVIAAVMRANTPAVAQAGERKCPECAEIVKAEAKKCRFCGAALPPVPARPVATVATPLPSYPDDTKADHSVAIGVSLVGVLVVVTAIAMVRTPSQPVLGSPTFAGDTSFAAHAAYDTEHIITAAGHPVSSGFHPALDVVRAVRRQASRTASPVPVDDPGATAAVSKAATLYALDTIGAVTLGEADVAPIFQSGDGASGYVDLHGQRGTGSVDVRFVVGIDGLVHAAVGESSVSDAVRIAAVSAVLGRTYSPGMKDGKPIRVRFGQFITVQ